MTLESIQSPTYFAQNNLNLQLLSHHHRFSIELYYVPFLTFKHPPPPIYSYNNLFH